MYKLVYYVPESDLETTKTAIFKAGAGRYTNYDQSCWQVKGVGQFRPLDSANPHIGTCGQLEMVDEYRVEVMCRDEDIESIIKALLAAHPYEEVAYEAYQLAYFPAS